MRVNDEYQRFALQNGSEVILQKEKKNCFQFKIMNRIIRCIKFYLWKLFRKSFSLCVFWLTIFENVSDYEQTRLKYLLCIASSFWLLICFLCMAANSGVNFLLLYDACFVVREKLQNQSSFHVSEKRFMTLIRQSHKNP